MTESIYNYYSFDLIESLENAHLYTYTRVEWPWILKNRICPYSRTPVPDIVLKTIELRNKIAVHLPEIITLGNGILNENLSQNSQQNSSLRSPKIQKLSELPINLEFRINNSDNSNDIPQEQIITNNTLIEEINLEDLDLPNNLLNAPPQNQLNISPINESYIGLNGIPEINCSYK
jgi:hypothetical protein